MNATNNYKKRDELHKTYHMVKNNNTGISEKMNKK